MSERDRPIIIWFRRDLRLSDHPALAAACAAGRPVIPVFVLDPVAEGLGAAPKFRLGLGIEALSRALADKGSRLVLRRGPAPETLVRLAQESGAGAVHWTRLYDPLSRQRDDETEAALQAAGVEVRTFGGHLLFEPQTVQTGQGGHYKVFTPFWRAVKGRDVPAPLPAPGSVPAPAGWPRTESLADWALDAAMNRGAAVVRPWMQLGEGAAADRLDHFMSELAGDYDRTRDLPGEEGTSRLSENLSLGEISPHRCWHAGLRAREEGRQGAETFLRELAWREFAYHLMYHTPRLLTRNWRPEWDDFPWREDRGLREVRLWQRARTGMPFVDAALREMFVTGRMHNRGRMIVASYLCKNLMVHWRIGQAWFDDCLTDWDPASNALGWQWVAGSGPDATPYFRVFNPETQLAKFDPGGAYVRRWIAEGAERPSDTALSYFDAIPRSWEMRPDAPYPAPVVSAAEGRAAALAAYQGRKISGE